MNTRITWLLPVKNGMPYLPETLASIEAQTYGDWEVLAWDNGSTDGSLAELERWIPHRLPGKIVADKPLPLGLALAAMVEDCRTELCARIDSDDVNRPERLERQVSFLDSHPEIAVVGTQINHLDQIGNNHGPLSAYPTAHDDIVNLMLRDNALAHPTVLFRRQAVIEAGSYRDRLRIEDYDLWMRLAARERLANLEEFLVDYRIHEKSVTREGITKNLLEDAVVRCFCENAPLLYGCTPEEAKLLRERRSPDAMKVLREIAAYLETTQKVPAQTRLRSATFIQAGRALLAPDDRLSGVRLAFLESPASGLPAGLSYAADQAAQLQIVGKLVRKIKERREIAWSQKRRRRLEEQEFSRQRPFREWLQARQDQHIVIHPSLELVGKDPPYDDIAIGSWSHLGRDVTIWISSDEGADPALTLGHHVYIGRNVFLGTFQPITIGPCVQIGAYCYITSANHRYARRDIPIIKQGFDGKPVTIEEDVWLGTHVVVLPGVTIGKCAIIAAGSIVTSDIPPYEIWGGSPAKFIKMRPEDGGDTANL